MDTSLIRSFCNDVLKMCDYVDYMSKLHDCNDCKSKKDCPYAPKLGEQVRINCFGWVGETDESN